MNFLLGVAEDWTVSDVAWLAVLTAALIVIVLLVLHLARRL